MCFDCVRFGSCLYSVMYIYVQFSLFLSRSVSQLSRGPTVLTFRLRVCEVGHRDENEKLFYELVRARQRAASVSVARPALITSDEWQEAAQNRANRFQAGDRRRNHSARGDGRSPVEMGILNRFRTESKNTAHCNASSIRVQCGLVLAECGDFLLTSNFYRPLMQKVNFSLKEIIVSANFAKVQVIRCSKFISLFFCVSVYRSLKSISQILLMYFRNVFERVRSLAWYWK